MSSDVSRDNQANNETQGDTKRNWVEETHSDDDIRCVTPGDIITNTETEVDSTSDTTCDKGADTKSDTLSDSVASESKAIKHTLESKGSNQKLNTSSDRPIDTEVSTLNDIEDDKPNNEGADVAAVHTCKRTHIENHSPCSTTDVQGEGKVDGESGISTSEVVDTRGDTCSDTTANVDSDDKVCTEYRTLGTESAHSEDAAGDKRMDIEGDTSSDRRTDTSSDKKTNTEGDTSGDKRTDTEGDTSGDKRTDTGEDVTDKETRSIGTTTKDDNNSNQRTIIDVYRKRMKQNGSGHKLKFLRPELVKAFIQ